MIKQSNYIYYHYQLWAVANLRVASVGLPLLINDTEHGVINGHRWWTDGRTAGKVLIVLLIAVTVVGYDTVCVCMYVDRKNHRLLSITLKCGGSRMGRTRKVKSI